MDVVLPKLYVKQSGALYGLGAPFVVRKTLMKADGSFDNEKFEALKKVLVDAMARAWADYARTWDLVQKNSKSYSAATEQEAAARIAQYLKTVSDPTLKRIQNSLNQLFDAQNPAWDNPETVPRVLDNIKTQIAAFQSDAETLKVATDMSFYSALKGRAAEILREVGEAGERTLGAGLWLAKNWPWLVGGAAVVIFVGPTLLKSFAGYKRGGAAGAAEAAAGDLERARSRAVSGMRRRRSRR